ncbi:MAG: transcription termination factor NusA, partial [Patescibacteria group bacterium]
MMDLKSLKRLIEQISDERGIAPDSVLEAIEGAIAAAYKKEYGERGEIVKAKIDLKTGKIKFWQIKTVVDESVVAMDKEEKKKKESEAAEESEAMPLYNPERHILLKEAKAIKPDVQLGDELKFELEEREDFGRIAAQSAKQVVLQKIREAEKESVKKEYVNKEGEIVSGVIQRVERGNVHVDLGRTAGVMFFNESIPGEYYRVNERMRFYLLAVQEEFKLPGLVLSRAHPQFVSKLFELEVPEIHDGSVEIKAIAREAGSRSKIAVASKIEGIDPVGACVGQRGTRVMAVTNELGNEKIDIIEWSEDPEKFLAASLSPAKVKAVEVSSRREARVYVPEDQLSLAIGKNGQNVRLAAKLTGWKIDVRS